MNMYRMGSLLGILTFSIFFQGQLFAQSADAPSEQSVKDHISSFATAYAQLPESKDKKSVLDHFARELKSNIFYFSISGKARINASNLEGFSAYLTRIINSNVTTFRYDLLDFPHVRVSGNQASTVVHFAYEIKEADGIWVKGEETVTYALRRKGDVWRIVYMNVVGMEDEKLKGSCLCELFVEQGKSTGVVAKTTVPTGQSYTTHYNDFDFKSNNGIWLVKTDNHRYRWKQGGEIKKVDESGSDVSIGTSNSQKETILLILRDDLYQDNCASLKTKVSK